MSALNFNISRTANIVDINDGAGNSTQLPHYGSFSYKETQAIEKLLDKGINENYRAEFVCAVLRERLKKDDPSIVTKPTEEILSYGESGESIPNSLLNAMYNFFDQERREWKPDTQRLQVRGKDAVQIACDYAKANQLAAVQRSDMVDSEIVFVVDDISKLEAETKINELMKESSVAALEQFDVAKIVELNRRYYNWNILANHIPDKKKSKVKALTGTETTGD